MTARSGLAAEHQDRANAAQPSAVILTISSACTEVFAACEDPHLAGRGLHDLRRLGAANVARVCVAVATVTDDTNSARSGEIHAPRKGATATTQLDSGHTVDIGNDRASSTRDRDGTGRSGFIQSRQLADCSCRARGSMLLATQWVTSSPPAASLRRFAPS